MPNRKESKAHHPPKAKGAAGRLPRAVILLGWVSFFADVSGEMVYPLLPLFVVGVLGASATSLGWIEGTAQAVIAFMTALAGWRSDRIVRGARRRLVYIRWGYGLPVLGKAILAAATAWPWVLVGRTTDRFGKGLRGSPRDALIADLADESNRGRAFGLHRAMDTAGAMVGVLVAALLLWWLGGAGTASAEQAHGPGWAFRVTFAISAVMGLAALALTFLVREAPTDRDRRERAGAEGKEKPRHRPGGGGWLALPRAYWVTMATLLVFALANSSDTFLLLRAGDAGLAPWAVVLAYALYNLTYALASYPAGILSDRVGRWRVIGVGWALYAAVYAGFAMTNAAGVWPLMALYGVYMGMTEGVAKALIADHAPPDRRGRAMGLFYLAIGLTTLASSVLGGLLWDHAGHNAPFWFGAACAAAAVLLLLLFRPGANKERYHGRPPEKPAKPGGS